MSSRNTDVKECPACKWCLKSGLEMECSHQCIFCFGNGFRTDCDCIEIEMNQGLDAFDRRDK